MPFRIGREIRELRAATPGTRFVEGFERTHVRNHTLRVLLVAIGVVIMVVAAVTFFVPGPNFVVVFAGLALVGGQSRTVAGYMDRAELRGRRFHEEVWAPSRFKPLFRLLAALFGFAMAATSLWISYERGLLPSWFPVLG